MFPNGMVITEDGQQLIVAELLGNQLTCFDIAPDGICLEVEGAIWVADPRSNRARRFLAGGRLAYTITVAEGRHVYACVLGGEDRRTLLLCTSVRGAAASEQRHGRIEMVRVDVPGVASL